MTETSDPLMGTWESANNSEFGVHSVQQNISVETYEAGGGKNSYHGVDYQLRLLVFFLLRGLENKYSFSLATDMKNAEKFDDVVLRLQNNSSGGNLYRLLQAKHRAGNNPGRITTSALLSGSTRGDFSLRAYFESYLKLRSKFTSDKDQIQDIIICTNVGFKNNDSIGGVKLSDALVSRENVDEIFHRKLLRFKEEFEGREILIEVLKKPLQGMTHSEGDIEAFLDKLSFAMDQYGNDALEKKNKKLFKKLCGVCDVETVFPLFEKRIREWMMSFEGKYFSAREAHIFIEHLKDKFGGMAFQFQDAVWNFTGRHRELEEIESARKSGVKTIVISGLGGVGKSELARKYVEKHKSIFKRIVWITADSRGTMLNSFHRLAERLGINVKEKQTKTMLDEIYTFFEGSDSVFVLDNVEKLNCEKGCNNYLKDFLPSGPKRPFVILTSRLQCNWEDVHNLPLSEMEEDDAVEFIKSNLPVETHSSIESIKKLAEKLQNFPLALQQAVAYIKKKHSSSILFDEKYGTDDYLESFTMEANEMLSCRMLSSSSSDYEKTIKTTWIMTFNSIKESANGETATKILNLISYFAPDNINTRNIAIYFGEHLREQVKKSLCLLKEFSVIVSHRNIISIHRLVQKVMRMKLKETGEEEKLLRWALESATEIEVDHKISLWKRLGEYKNMQIEFSHLPGNIIDCLTNSIRYEQACLFGRTSLSTLEKICEPTYANLLDAIDSFATALYLNGKYEEALRVNEGILCLARKEVLSGDFTKLRDKYNVAVGNYFPGTNTKAFERITHHEGEKEEIKREDPYLLNSICKLADCCLHLEDYSKALILYEEAYEIEKEILGDDHPNLYITKNDIAQCYLYLGDHIKALTLYQEVYDKEKIILENNYPCMLRSKHGMAGCYSALGNYAKALSIYKEVCKIREENLGNSHPSILISKFEIARSYSNLGDYTKALSLFEEIYEIRVEILGDFHTSTLNTKHEIAKCYSNLGDYAKALLLYKKVYEKRAEILGEFHTSTLRIKHGIAQCYDNLGEYNKALFLYEEVHGNEEEILGEFDTSTLKTKYGIAMCYKELGNYAKARLIYQVVYEKEIEILGDKHPDTLRSKFQIADCYKYMGDYKKALLLYEEVYDKNVEILGDFHDSTLFTKYGIAQCYVDLGEYKKALSLYEEVYEKEVEIHGEFDTSTLKTKYGIAMCYKVLGYYTKAFTMFEEVYKKQNGFLGENHPDTLIIKNTIADCFSKKGEYTKAMMLYTEVYNKQKEILGNLNPHTLRSKCGLAHCYSELGDYTNALLIYEEVYDKQKEIIGDKHPDALNTKYKLAKCYSDLGENNKSLILFEEVYEQRKEILGVNHPNTVISKNGIAACFSKLGDCAKALTLFEEVYEKLKELLGDKHPKTLCSEYGIAVCYSDLGDNTKALMLFNDIYEKQKEVLGDKHPDALTSLYRIADCYSKLGDYYKALVIYEEIIEKQKQIIEDNHPQTLALRLRINEIKERKLRFRLSKMISLLNLNLNTVLIIFYT